MSLGQVDIIKGNFDLTLSMVWNARPKEGNNELGESQANSGFFV